MKLTKALKNNRGVTLFEVLVSSFILTIALGGLIASIGHSLYLIDVSGEQTTASEHLHDMVEQIRAEPWDQMGTTFPESVTNGDGNEYAGVVGELVLGNEQIWVRYPASTDLDGDADPDLVEVEVTLQWQDKRGHPHVASLTTFRAR
ncbi:MAG: prepilin-type N-terminal cleavage/methylation domain-containing protein [Candidatus Omnitrophica bacterium]|nr:prepilin-type N-terminal cleavage/methylation domain-containing protein [Candidatus Omnitrophota bacterium]